MFWLTKLTFDLRKVLKHISHLLHNKLVKLKIRNKSEEIA